MIVAMKKTLRAIAYATPAYRWFGFGQIDYDGAFWDKKLATDWKTYLGGTISVNARNAITLTLLRSCVPAAQSVLDVGCASGSLARAPGAAFTYTGVDISPFAIEQGRKQSPMATFHISKIDDFKPTHNFDAIVFNEVLYFLTPTAATEEVLRYAKHLSADGIIVVSMKNDPKSAAIFRLLQLRLQWINALLYQEKNTGPDFAVIENNQRPAYLVAALRPFMPYPEIDPVYGPVSMDFGRKS